MKSRFADGRSWVALGVALQLSAFGAAAAGANGAIVFQNSPGLSTIKPDGTGLDQNRPVPLTFTPFAQNPDWSADGSRLVFDDDSVLWIVNADGSDLHRVPSFACLAPGDICATDPSWSPDGLRIAFESRRFVSASSRGAGSIAIVDADGRNLLTLAAATSAISYSQPAWSPKPITDSLGRVIDWTIAFVSDAPIGFAPGNSIQTITVNGRHIGSLEVTDHEGIDATPAWSPDGTLMVFTRRILNTEDVYRLIADGKHLSTQTNLTPQHNNFWTHPVWSPDGALIAAAAEIPTFDIWTFSSTTGYLPGSPTTNKVTSIDNADMPAWQPLNTRAGTNVSVSPRDATTGSSPVTVTFSAVTTAGQTTLATSGSGPAVPAGFVLNPSTYYNLVTTAVFAPGTATVCIRDAAITSLSRLFHYQGGVAPPVDVTDTASIVAGVQICSLPLTSLSPFAIARPAASAPVANAGADQTMEATGAATHVTLDGSLSSGTALTFLWTEGASSLAAGAVVDVALALGAHHITLTVTDSAGLSATSSVVVTIVDTIPPSLTCPPMIVAECTGGASANVTPGTASASDATYVTVTGPAAGPYPLGATTVTYVARDQAGLVTTCSSVIKVVDTTPPLLTCGVPRTIECSAPGGATVTPTASCSDSCTSCRVACASAFFPLGSFNGICSAQDESGNQASCSQQITVADTTPPSLSVTAAPAILAPPNHKLVHITVTTAVSDVCDPAPRVDCIATSNEPARRHGEDENDGEEEQDIILRNGQLFLRAERNPHGMERVYTITCKATDASGNSTSAVALVIVPGRDHDEDGRDHEEDHEDGRDRD